MPITVKALDDDPAGALEVDAVLRPHRVRRVDDHARLGAEHDRLVAVPLAVS
jgi:hypothetical protein